MSSIFNKISYKFYLDVTKTTQIAVSALRAADCNHKKLAAPSISGCREFLC